MLKEGTIVDATIIQAPSSTQNREGQRDPEMHQVQKGKQYYLGMKLHNGVDAQSGMVHSMVTTPANVHDVAQAGKLLHGKERRVWGDAGYLGVGKRKENLGLDEEWLAAMRPGKRRLWNGAVWQTWRRKGRPGIEAWPRNTKDLRRCWEDSNNVIGSIYNIKICHSCLDCSHICSHFV